jgi:ELWxxDGT repeat protein
MVPFRMLNWVQRSLGLRPRLRRVRRRKIAGLSHGAMSGHVVHLEPRILPAAAINVADLNGDPDYQNDSSNAREFTTIGTRTYFTYNTQVTNKPVLAYVDSATGLTTTLPDQTNFRFSPNTQISELTAFQGQLFFVATDGNASMALGRELWRYNPATNQFDCITDFDGVNPTTIELPDLSTRPAINGRQTLTDGTTTGNSKNEGSNPAHLTVSGGKLYFTATDDLSGQGGNRELYFYDGTKVRLVRDINTNPIFFSGSSTPLQLVDAGGLLYFTAVDTASNGRELWRTDGSVGGTFMLANIKPNGDGDISDITPAGGTNVFFSANDGATGNELWFSDGNSAGTRLVKDIQGVINGVNQGSNPSSMLWVNGTLYFNADDGVVGKELWKTDGTDAGTVLVRDIAQTGPNGVFDVKQNSNPHNLTLVNGVIYFSANDGKEGFELWRTDGTTAGTQIVQLSTDPSGVPGHPFAGINRNLTSSGDSTAGSYPGSLLNVNGTLYFVATDTYDQFGRTNFELWRVNAATGMIESAAQTVSGSVGSNINRLSNVWQSQFDIPDPQQDFTYAKSSADAFRPTEVIPDASPTGFRSGASNKQLFLGPGNLIYFTADNGANGSKVSALGEYLPNFEPWRFDTTTRDARIVKDMTEQSLSSLNPFGYTTTNVQVVDPATGFTVSRTRTFFFFTDPRLTQRNIGLAYFDAQTGVVTDSGQRFESIGTTARPNPVVFGNNSILFIANGNEVWRTNGTTNGTDVVVSADVAVDLLTVSGNRYYVYAQNTTFSGNTQTLANGELWSGTTGSSFGGRIINTPAELVQEIAPTVNAFNRSAGIQFIVPRQGGGVWFNANDFGAPNNGSRDVLWVSNPDDNTIGTRIVVSAAAVGPANPTGPQGPRGPYTAASSGNVVYFAAGTTLYRSQLLFNNNAIDAAATDGATRPISGNLGLISNITPVANGVFFVVNGTTLYFSDGVSPANTVAVTNGTFGSLTDFRYDSLSDRLYFIGNGTGVYSVDPSQPVPTAVIVNQLTTLTNVNSLVLTGTRLYFSARTVANGQELWTSLNGAEPTRVTDIRPGNASSLNLYPDGYSRLGVSNTRVFFGANDAQNVETLNSISIGGSSVSGLPDIIRPTTANSGARDFIVYDQDSYGNAFQPTVYFWSDVGPMSSVLSQLSTNPAAPSGIVTLSTINSYRYRGGSPGDFVSFDDFYAVHTQIESVPTQYQHFGEYGHPQSDFGIYKSGRTATANRTNAGYLGQQFLFFSGFSGENTGGNTPFYYGQELYVLFNGVPVRITDLRVASNSAQGNANPGYLTSIGNNADGQSTMVLFAASNGPTAGALYKVTVPATGAPASWAVAQISSAAVNPRYLQSLGGGEGTDGLIYFTAGTEQARTAWVTDGFTAIQLSSAIVDESAGDGKIFGYSNGKVYFSAREPGPNTDNFELYMTDHAQLAVTTGSPNNNNAQTRLGANNTVQLRAINPSATQGSRPGNFTDVNGVMYFAANDGTTGFELWKTDGTAAGTVLVLDLEAGAAGSNPGVVISQKTTTDLEGVTTTSFVYEYQGFAVGNTRPDEFGATNAGVNAPAQENPAKPNSGDDNGTPTLLFAATTTQYGRELFQVTPAFDFDGDGDVDLNDTRTFTFGGQSYTLNSNQIQIVKDIAPGSRSSNPVNLTAIDGTLYFSADDGLTGDTLWQSTGLDQITGNTLTRKMIDDQELSAGNSALVNGIRNPDDFTLLTTNNKTINRLIFTAANDLGKTELYQLNINHTPVALNLSSNAVAENRPQGTVVGAFATTDPDFGDTFQYQFVAGAGDTDNSLFQIVGTSLQIRGTLDFETKNQYSVRIRTTDQRGQFYERSFTVNVSDVNEAPGGLTFVDPVTSVDLNGVARIDEVPSVAPADPAPTTQDILLANLVATGDDAITANNVFSIVPGQLDANSFVVDKRNGLQYQVFLKAGAVLNFETKGQYQVNIQIVDPTVANSTPIVRTFTLILNDLNESPIGSLNDSDPTADTTVMGIVFNGAVDENSTFGTTVGITALAIDPDTQLNPVTYTLTDNAGGRFQIDANTGVVTVRNLLGNLLNYEVATQHTITVRADSSDGTFSTASFNIRVLDVDEFDVTPIIDTDAAPNQVLENSPAGTPVGITAFASDADGSNNVVTYSLYADAGGRFQIDPNTGVVTVKTGGNLFLNRETEAAWWVGITATSQDGSTSTQAFTINLVDVNEFAVGPVNDINPADNRVLEGAANGTPVGLTARAVDADATNNTVTYSLTANGGGRFAIDPNTGVVTVANGALIDREQTFAWSVTVLATSSDGSTSSRAFTIFIDDVNEFSIGPVNDINGVINAVNENAATGTPVGITAKATDNDATAVITYSLTDNAGGRFQVNPSTGVVSVLNGSLLNRETAATYSITVRAASDDGTFSTASFVININDVNEFPVGPIQNVGSGTLTVNENSAVGTLVGITARAVDPDATNNTVTYTLPNSAGGRFSVNPVTGVVSVANPGLLDAETATSHTITVRAQSADGSFTTRDFTITVLDVNDNPVTNIIDTNAAVNQVQEGAPTGTLVGITAFAQDNDITKNKITYSLQDTSAGRYKIDPVTGVVMVDDGTKIDFENGPTNTIIVKATSEDGTFKTQSFFINVLDVAETPVLQLSSTSVAENMPIGTTVGAFSVKDATPTGPVYTLVSGTGATNNSSFQIVGNQLRTRSSFNFEAKSSYSIRVQMRSSNGIVVQQVFTINVTNVNERPTNVTLSRTSVPRNSTVGTVVGTLAGTDPDAGSTFNYSLVGGQGSTNNSSFTVVGNQLRVNGPLTGSRMSIRVRVTDQFGLSFERVFTIRLT